jgi:hypothetical protein
MKPISRNPHVEDLVASPFATRDELGSNHGFRFHLQLWLAITVASAYLWLWLTLLLAYMLGCVFTSAHDTIGRSKKR